MAPTTYIGRTITILTAVFGLFFTATLVGLISEFLSIKEEESIVINYIKDNGNLKEFRKCALDCVMETVRTFALTRSLKRKECYRYKKHLSLLAAKFKYMRM